MICNLGQTFWVRRNTLSVFIIVIELSLCSKGHFYLTKLLLPSLCAGAKSSPDGKARVINTSSSGSHMTNTLDFNTFKESSARRKYGLWSLYFQSKLVSLHSHCGFVKRLNEPTVSRGMYFSLTS